MKMNFEQQGEEILLLVGKLERHFKLSTEVGVEAMRLYNRLVKRDCIAIRGKTENMVSLIYIVTRKKDSQILIEDLAKIFGTEEKVIFKYYKKNIRALDLHIKPENAKALLNRYAKELKIKPKQYEKAEKIISKIKLEGKSRKAIVLSTLAHVAKIHPDKIKKRYGVSFYTMRNYKKIIEGKVIKDDKKFNY